MTEEERAAEREKDRKERDNERLDSMETFMLLMASCLAGGHSPKIASQHADAAIAECKKRFG